MVKSARPPSTVKVRNGCPTAASTTASQTQMLVATTTPSQAPSRSESCLRAIERPPRDRKSTRLNSSHSQISYAVFCLKKKNNETTVDNDDVHRPLSDPAIATR